VIAPPQYLLDTWVRRWGDGRILAGGAPSRLLSLTPAGRIVVDELLAGERPTHPHAPTLIRRLLTAGFIHPAGGAEKRQDTPVTTVVPVLNGARWLTPLIEALVARGEVIVVDDGSSDRSVELARSLGARVLVNRYARGQSGARNTGIESATSELVALVDQDCRVAPDWLDYLVGLFDDPTLAIAAPRVRSVPGRSWLARYERCRSPLDLGPHPSLIGPGRRLTYVPSAALLARRSALLEIGGFAAELRVGEDVDLVWRLLAAGWTARYAPGAEVQHHPRDTVTAMAVQRFRYGASAPILQRRHPGAATALHAPPHTVAIWMTGAGFGSSAAAGAFAVSVLASAVGARTRESRRAIAGIAATGHLRATRYLARMIVREWLPLTLAGCAASPRVRRVALSALALDVIASPHDEPRQPILATIGLRSVDLVAYSAGAWRGSLRQRSVGALTVRVIRRHT
jgi:mycofactocin system glycosyltransferase